MVKILSKVIMLKSIKPYLLLSAILIVILSLPQRNSELLRGKLAEMVSPLWSSISFYKSSSPETQEIQKLKLENSLLTSQLDHLKAILKQEGKLITQLRQLDNDKAGLEKRHRLLLKKLDLQLHALPAQVIYRAPSSWHSSLWVNVGTDDNTHVGIDLVAKNSPVVIGNAVVGVVDYVGKKQSRVRLITDSGLTPSVRAERDGLLLAKGEVSGTSAPLWRSSGTILKGTGFNYDFADDEGTARELRSGIPLSDFSKEGVPLLKVNDMLVTTGLDGVFPAGLKVGVITNIKPLQEGDYYYDLESTVAAGDLLNLTTVFIMPPVGFVEMEFDE